MKYLKAFVAWFLQGILAAALLVFFVVLFAEWMAGCGETYVDSKGKRHQHECIFIKR